MESIETFVDVFQKSWKEKNRQALTQLLNDLPGYLKNTSLTDADHILEILMLGQNGLFQCIRNILNEPKGWSGSDAFLKDSFEAMKHIMDYSQEYYEPYIMETRTLCFYCMKTKCWYYSRKTATETFRKLIESYSYYDMKLDEIVEYFNDSYLRLYSKKDGSVFYTILGAIGKCYPKLKKMEEHINTIFIQLLKDLISQHSSSNPRQPEEIKIYLDCYWDLFVYFVPLDREPPKSEVYLRNLHDMILLICEPEKAQKSYRDKAIKFLFHSTNIDHFEPSIFENYEKWYTLFNIILEDVETTTILSSLRNFYRIIAERLMKEQNESVFWFFRHKFVLSRDSDQDLTPRRLQSIVNGLGEFAVTYPNYAPTESHNVFQLIAARALHTTDKVDDDFETTANYLKTLSQILHYASNPTFYQVGILAELSLRFVKGFPELRKYSQSRAMKALNATFVNLSYLEKHLQREFFHSVFREGILWSCSHTLYVDVQLQQEFESIPKKQICYKDYLPFWHTIFRMDIEAEEEEYDGHLTVRMFKEFVSVFMMYITKLNLNVVSQDDESFSNTLMCLKAENETDFWFFINLVDLYLDILEHVDSELLQNSKDKLTTFLIKYSYKYPLISGFYKLIKVILKNSKVSFDQEDSFSIPVKELICQYLSDILNLISGFSEELQFSCICLMFSTPPFIVKILIDKMLPIFEIAFNVGLSNLPLAYSALKTLEDWLKDPTIRISNSFLKTILGYTEPYLSTNESSSKAIQNNTKLEIYDSEINLEDLQKKILLFHGSLDTEILFNFVHEKSTNTNASWNKKDLLQCELLFPDIRLEMHMDKFLARIIELTNSGDQKIKVCACELFHSLITIILGKKLMDQCFNENLCLAVLRLGCDAVDGVKNLFHPLALQLTHYLSSSLMKESRIPQIFVDSLFEGLSEEFNTTMRDHCGLYLKEFMQWSIKQSADHDLTKDPNVLSVIRKINTLAVYPSNKKRLAAVSAFNNLYTILRENLSIVQTYWLEFLYVFIKCLEEYDNMHVVSAIDHVEKVIIYHKNVFNAKNRHRKKPLGFADETLGGCLIWSFAHCDSLDSKCRNKCMKLFENLLPLVNHPEAVKHELEKKASEIVSKNLKADFDSISLHNGQAFLKILDFCIWIMKKNFISSTCLFNCNDISDDIDTFSNYFCKFVKIISSGDALKPVDATKLVEIEEHIDLMNEITLKILEFISTVLDTQENHNAIIPWNNNLHVLLVRLILNPEKSGLTFKKILVSDKYYTHLENFLTLMMNRTSTLVLKEFLVVFIDEADKHFPYFAEIRDIVDLKGDMQFRISRLKFFVKGLLIVKKTKFYDFEEAKNFTFSYWQGKIDEIFISLKVRSTMGSDVGRDLNERVKDYLNDLMTLYFETYKPETARALVHLIAVHVPLDITPVTKISHGEYFLDTFREPIFSYMLKDVSATVATLDEIYAQYPHIVFCILEELLLFAQRNKRIESEELAKEVLKSCGKLKRLVNDLEDRKTKFFSINHLAVKLMKNPTEIVKNTDLYRDMHYWLIAEFAEAKDLEKKATLLQHFIVCLADDTMDSDNSFLMLPTNLREMGDEDWLQTMKTNEVKRFHAATLFGVLLKSLLVTRSLLVYRSAVSFSAGVCKLLHKESLRKYLDPYFASISDQFALKSLEVCYQIFMDLNLELQRLDVLRSFLLPSLESNKHSVVEKFYEKFGQELAEYVKQNIDSSNVCNAKDRKKLIVTKTACYSIFELLFAKFDIKFANVKDKTSGAEKTLSSILVEESVKLRFYSTAKDDEKEITRMMHCAALNCCISVVSLKKEEKFYKFIFMEDRAKEQLLWERIVDCQKIYKLVPPSSSSIRKDRRKLINIRSDFDKHHSASQEFAVSYMHRRDLSQLSFIEDIHAYDLNDMAVSSEPCKKPDGDCRLDLSFENDELNEHECMPMISGVLIHMFNAGVTSLPEPDESNVELPLFLKHFRNGLVSNEPNVILFMLKIISNTKDVFLPYFKHMFLPIAKALIRFFSSSRGRINYIVRDILLMIIESKFVPPSSVSDEVNTAQSLFESVFFRAQDEYAYLQKYNLEIIESLCTLWSKILLTWPSNMNSLLSSNSKVGFNVLLIFLRTNAYDARNEITRQQFLKDIIIKTSLAIVRDTTAASVAMMEIGFEILGTLLRFSDDRELEEKLVPRILAAFGSNIPHNTERSARYACALYMGWKSEGENCTKLLSKFACPRTVLSSSSDACRCLEVYLVRLNTRQIDPEKLITELDTFVGLKAILSSRILACLGPALRILERLVALLPESAIREYLEYVAKGYCSPALCLLEHRMLAYRCLGEAYARYPDSPSAELWLVQLVRGLEDPCDEVQDQLVDFWRSRLQFPDTCCDRLLKVLSMYTSNLSDGFARLLCLMMLELTSKSPDADRPMFRPLIEQCNFREWNPTAGANSRRRLQQLGSLVPLFAPSLLQATQRLEHRILASGTCSAAEMGNTFLGSLKIRATGELIFEPTLPSASQSGRSQTRIPDPSQNRLSRRLVSNSFTSTSHGEHQKDYHEQLRKEKESRLSSCKLYRKYRIGDFPDVELTHSSFVLSLRQLMMRDWLFCKDLTVGLVCSLIDRLKGSDKYLDLATKISSTFNKVLGAQEEINNFAPAALEIAQHAAGDVELKSSCVERVCQNMKLYALGIVLLEEDSIREYADIDRQQREDEPPVKRAKRRPDNWIELVTLYKSIGYPDVVSSIFRHTNTFSSDLRNGTLAQLAGDWTTALEFYKNANNHSVGLEEDYCLDSMFECMRELSDWGEINSTIDEILQGDYKAVWSHQKKNQLLPWIFEAQLHKSLDDYSANKDLDARNMYFIQNVNEWINLGDLHEIRRNFGQELSVLLLCSGQKSEEASRFCINVNLNRIREQWIRLSTIAQNARLGILTKLRGMHNIETYINTLKADDIKQATKSLIRYWDRHLPSANDDFTSWNMHVAYRLTFTKLLHEKLHDSSLANDLLVASLKQRITICDLAMINKNKIVAKKHSSRIEKLIYDLNTIRALDVEEHFCKLQYDFMLIASKYKFLCGELESVPCKKFLYHVRSWKVAYDVLDDEHAKDPVKIKTQYHLFDLASSYKQLLVGNSEHQVLFMADPFVISKVVMLRTESFAKNLVYYSLNCLKNACSMGSSYEMAESYAKLGKYCYSLIQADNEIEWNFIDEFISSILTGMSLGSLEAAHYFPCLLKDSYYNNEHTKQIFALISANVPTWLFLFWQAQIVINLNAPLAQLLIPVMQKLVQYYPNAVVYDFRQMYNSVSQELQADPDVRRMYESLFPDSKLESFLEAMHRVCQPEHYLSQNLSQLRDSKENIDKGIESLIEKVYGEQTEDQGSIQGALYKIALGKYRVQLETLKKLDFQTAKHSIDKLIGELHESMKRRIADGKYQAFQLKDYSPYLDNFTEKDLEIEIPGQYCKYKKPLPRYHTKISKFDRYVRVMDSKCNPIKINMIGNDAKAYGFLVKFGEDLRQDQRLQQIFNIANETFDSDKICNRRYLSINTYHVQPLSTSLGLIEWVDGTRSFKEFIEFSMKDKSVMNTVARNYQSWIDKAAKPGKHGYKEALIKYDRKTVISKMKEFIGHFDWDCLRKTFMVISPNLECFVSLRHNFITSYATMCVVHWITGVGDRHVENMLIEVKSGKCYGIDFGAAYGAGIDQAIPELVPFRLTPQILGLFKPFDEQGLFGITMTHVLRALRNERNLIVAYLDVFVHEPLNWSKNRHEKSREDSNYFSDITWSAEKKMKTVRKKLDGMNPSTIMIEELANMHSSDDEYFSRYTSIIYGTDQNNVSYRSTMRNMERISPEEQVKCLLEHAKDLSVLGRMYVGWCPFV